jgi:CBS domain-containing protein
VKDAVLRIIINEDTKSGKLSHSTYYITPQATINEIINILIENDIDRVFIVTNTAAKYPIGIVSAKDLIGETLAINNLF